MSNVGIKVIVEGRVQGVFFRKSTQRKAKALGLTGWVANTSNGCVELIAMGDEKILQQFQQWLQVGPPLANVMHLHVKSIPYEWMDDFEVKAGM